MVHIKFCHLINYFDIKESNFDDMLHRAQDYFFYFFNKNLKMGHFRADF